MNSSRNNAVIVAHPDDETLWCGGQLLQNSSDNWFVASLCRKDDPDRAPKFHRTLSFYNANGAMGTLDDGPLQEPQSLDLVEALIMELLTSKQYDRIYTHSPFGEYTTHLRHEEVGRAVLNLWQKQKLTTSELFFFAYEDGQKSYYPRAIEKADYCKKLPLKIWLQKYDVITQIYGFDKHGFEAKTTPEKEAFWIFNTAEEAVFWKDHYNNSHLT